MTSDPRHLRHFCTALTPRSTDPDLDHRIARALASPALVQHRALLERQGRHIDPHPLLIKNLEHPYMRLFFSVAGVEEIRRGTIVAIAVLYDLMRDQTWHAHPVFAGPETDPQLHCPGSPLAKPMPQFGPEGEPALHRFIEHKRAVWDRFERECRTIGRAEAGRRWRESYHWALERLHFCDQCEACRWCEPPAEDGLPVLTELPDSVRDIVDDIVCGDVWKLEADDARRGGFPVRDTPRFVEGLDHRFSLFAFPAAASPIQDGAIVGLAAYYDHAAKLVRYVHVLTAGPEPELPFLFGERELGLPLPKSVASEGTALNEYARWKRAAWTAFWGEELDYGNHVASGTWRRDYWTALETLVRSEQTDRRALEAHDTDALVRALPEA